jgi:hypothetical protein
VGIALLQLSLDRRSHGKDLGWSKPDLYGAATIGRLLSGLAAYPVGSAIDRGHGRTIMAGASVLAGILLIAWLQVESIAGGSILRNASLTSDIRATNHYDRDALVPQQRPQL